MTKSAKRKAHDAKKSGPTVAHDTSSGLANGLANLPRIPLQPPYAPVLVTRLDMAFPANVTGLMPAYDSIPEEFRQHGGRYYDLFVAWFYKGLSKFEPVLRDPTMNINACLGHIACVKGSYEPKHEHKTATVRFLLDTWFSSIVWEAAS